MQQKQKQKQKPRGRGRPPLEDEAMLEPVTIRLPPVMMREIEALQRERLDAPNKSTIIREHLASVGREKKEKGPQVTRLQIHNDGPSIVSSTYWETQKLAPSI
jgi:hypothetical protein